MNKLNIKYISNRLNQEHLSFKIEPLTNVELPDICCLDLETTGLIFNKNKVLLVILGNENIQYVIDYCSIDKDLLRDKLSKVKLFIGHNLSFDLPFLMYNNFNFHLNTIYDTMETELTLIKGTAHSVSLKNTVKRRLNIDTFDKGITIEFTMMNGDNPFFDDRHIKYAAEDILYLEDLRKEQLNFITKYQQNELTNYNNNMVIVVSKMKVDGIYVNKDKWMKLYNTNLAKVDELEVLMDEELARLGLKQRKKRVKERTLQLDILGGAVDIVNKNADNINYGSSSQVVSIFNQLNLPIPKSAKEDKNSIGKATLQQYIIDRPNSLLIPFLNLLITYKDVVKKSNTFGKKWIEEYVDSDGRVRASFKINRTTTGRLSCSSPNLQQIPSDQVYRDCFEGEGSNMFWGADLSGAELKILASLSGDTVMLDLIKNDGDIHGFAATQVLRYLKNDQTLIVDKNNNKEFRGKMKNVIFSLLYGSGVNKIAELLDISVNKAEDVYKILKKTFPQTFVYLEEVSNFGVSKGYVIFEKKWNGRRWFPEIFSGATKSQKSAVERYSKNSPIQGTNAVMIKKIMVDLYEFIEINKLSSRIIASIHDEIIIELGEKEEIYSKEFENIMLESSNYFLDGVKMESESYICKHWKK